MEHDVRADQIRRHVGQYAGGDFPEQGMMLMRPAQAAQPGRIGGMSRRKVKDFPRSGFTPAQRKEVIHHRLDVGQLSGPKQGLDDDVAVAEIRFPLALAKHACRVGKYRFGRHGVPISLATRQYLDRGC